MHVIKTNTMAKQEQNDDIEKTKSVLQKHINSIKNKELPLDSFQDEWNLFEEIAKVIVGTSTNCQKSTAFIELLLNEFKEKLEKSNQPSKRRRRKRIQENCLNSDSEDDEEEKDYDVKKVIGKFEDDNGKVKYRIVWENTWESKDQLSCDEKIAAYEENPNKTDVRKVKGKDVDKDGNVLYRIEWEDTWEPKYQLSCAQGCIEKIAAYENSQKRKSEQKTTNDETPLKRSKNSSSSRERSSIETPHQRRSPRPSNSSSHRSGSSSRPSTSSAQNQESRGHTSNKHPNSHSSNQYSSSRPFTPSTQNQDSRSHTSHQYSSSRPSNCSAQNQDSRSHTSHQYSSSRPSTSSAQNQDSRSHSSRPSTSSALNKESWGHTCWDRNNENPCPKCFKFQFIPYHSSSFQDNGSGNYSCTLNLEITKQILDIFKYEKSLWPTDFKLFPTKDCSRNFQLKKKTVRFKPSKYDPQIRRKEPETLVEIEFSTHV